MDEVIIISGPTATGKSAKALELARKLNAEIISCDSIQVYRHMDIGSAKPNKQELTEIRHHLIDVCDPSVQFNIADYVELAKSVLEDIKKRGKQVIVTGGSGFYLKSWFCAVTDKIEVSEEIKAEVANLAKKEGAILKKLLELDPNSPKSLDIQNSRRLRPALERIMASGLSLKELADQFDGLPCPMGDFKKEFELIDLPDTELFERVRLRVDKMIKDGLVDETRKLIGLGIEKNPSAAMAIGYRETISAIRSNDFSNLSDDIYKNTVALIRKQRKFFKNALFKNVKL